LFFERLTIVCKTHTPMMERINAVLESIAPGKLVEIH